MKSIGDNTGVNAMAPWRPVYILGIALCMATLAAPGKSVAAEGGYTVADIQLSSAGALVSLCTTEPAQENYATALAFCYGFFEGGIRYHQAISGPGTRKHLVCAPEGTTRLQAVDVFVSYMEEHPEYLEENPIDAIFRALMARWPCPPDT